MITIRFSHYYKKMPDNLKGTYLYNVEVTSFEKLTPEFIDQDTETIDGKFYPLPAFGRCLILRLMTGKHKWQTVRPWNPGKERYYRDCIGTKVHIAVG